MGPPKETWTSYRRSIGDRSSLFAELVAGFGVVRALYPGSYLDLSPSTAIRDVLYVDSDRRAARFFGDQARVVEELAGRVQYPEPPLVRFAPLDYRVDLPLPEASADLVISLYAGLVWDSVARYLRPGGLLLANNSHGDASIAALDPALTLVAAVTHTGDRYRLATHSLERYLVPKKPEEADPDRVRRAGRGLAFTYSCFAYVFRYTPPSS